MAEIRKEQIDYDDDISINGSLTVDNVNINGNTVSSTSGNMVFSANGNATSGRFESNGTGSHEVIDIIPSAAITDGSAIWKGININAASLDPATSTFSLIFGNFVDFSGIASVDGDASLFGYTTETAEQDTNFGFSTNIREITSANKVHTSFYSSLIQELSTTATYRGLNVEWATTLRDDNAPILEGIKSDLPADYTGFGSSFAGKFTGGGGTVTLCDGTDTLTADNVSITGNTVSSTNPLQLKDSFVTGSVPLGESGETALVGFTKTSLVGSLNELRGPARFEARSSSTQSNATGDGTLVTAIFGTEIQDVGNNYNATTGVFTAPVTGTYFFNTIISLQDILVAHTSMGAYFSINDPAGAQRGIFFGNATNTADAVGSLKINGSDIIQLTASDTVEVVIFVLNGTKTIDILSGVSQSYFSGYLLGT